MPESEDKPRFPGNDVRVDYGVKVISNPKRLADFSRQEDERRERHMQERAEQARRDAIGRFILHRQGPTVFTCPFCAALVTDREKHLDWHADLAATAAQASSAHFYNTPIG